MLVIGIVKPDVTRKRCNICYRFIPHLYRLRIPPVHFKCRKCGLQADRHLTAAWDIAAKHPMYR